MSSITDDVINELSDLVWTSSYRFSLVDKLKYPSLGWRIGHGSLWQKNPHGRVDLLIALKEDAWRYMVHGNHALFNILFNSGAFAIKAMHDRGLTCADAVSSQLSQKCWPYTMQAMLTVI